MESWILSIWCIVTGLFIIGAVSWSNKAAAAISSTRNAMLQLLEIDAKQQDCIEGLRHEIEELKEKLNERN